MSLLRVDNEDKALSRGLSPGSLVSEKSQLEVELMRRNSIAYLVLQSIPLASLENSDLPLPVNMTREESQEHRYVLPLFDQPPKWGGRGLIRTRGNS